MLIVTIYNRVELQLVEL